MIFNFDIVIKKRNYFFVIIVISFLFSNCKKKNECISHPDVSSISVKIKIDRLEQQLFQLQTKEEIKNFLSAHPSFAHDILETHRYPSEEVAIDQLQHLIQDPYMDTLYQDTKRVFGDLSQLKKELEQAFRLIKYYYPSFREPVVQTMVTGFATDLYINDSILFIGLDYFIGPTAHYRPEGKANYILKRYQSDYIVSNSILLLSRRYNTFDELDQTLLASMIYWGKAYYFTKQILPCIPDSLIIGYSNEEIQRAQGGETQIWQYIIEKKILFQNNPILQIKYIEDRPYTAEIGSKCPGRIGQWIGWQITNSYVKRNSISLPNLMKNLNSQEIFEKSDYHPTK